MTEFHRLKSRHDPAEPVAWQNWNLAAERRASDDALAATMPSLQHLKRADYQEVYEPAEDTFLLLDALQYELEQGVFNDIAAESNDNVVDDDVILLEIGCGTGVPTVWFRQAWQKRYPNRKLRCYVTDINPRALQVALQTDACNNPCVTDTDTNTSNGCLSPIHALSCDLATDLLDTLRGAVHIIIFNPPYVPTPDEEVVDFSASSSDENADLIAAAWAGGQNGRRVVDRAMPQIQQLLASSTSTSSAAYLVTVDDNQPAALAELCATQYQLQVRPLLRRRAHNEYLTIQKIVSMTRQGGENNDKVKE